METFDSHKLGKSLGHKEEVGSWFLEVSWSSFPMQIKSSENVQPCLDAAFCPCLRAAMAPGTDQFQATSNPLALISPSVNVLNLRRCSSLPFFIICLVWCSVAQVTTSQWGTEKVQANSANCSLSRKPYKMTVVPRVNCHDGKEVCLKVHH